MDQPKLERLLRLMKLLTANTTYDIDQLAERLQMSRRTVYRYIDTFREAGFVTKSKSEILKMILFIHLFSMNSSKDKDSRLSDSFTFR